MDEIEIADVHQEITRLWREAAADAGEKAEKAEKAMTRATTLNLVVAGCGDEQEGLSQILSETTASHPCRVIVIQTDEEQGTHPRAWVSMMCHSSGRGQPQVCSEQLVLAGPRESLHELVASVAGLLVADLPTFVWWRGRLPETDLERERFGHLQQVADRVLVDSARFSAGDLARVAELCREFKGSIGDLNWARLTPWRVSVAQSFDPPAVQALLPNLEKVEVHYAQEAEPAARLMAGWLRSRLGRRVPAELVVSKANVLELFAGGHNFVIASPDTPSESAALAEELRVLGRDQVFEEALFASLE